MFDKESLNVFVEKVPDFRSPWKVLLIVGYTLLLSGLSAAFFFHIDRLVWYAPIISQLVMAIIVTIISYLHFEKVTFYREHYGPLAYRYYFYHFMVPYVVTWAACFLHPLFVSGPPLLPWWVAAALGMILLLLCVLTIIHIERAGFAIATYGMEIYTVFPEEATPVYGEIYGYIRHPMYFALMCGGIGLGLLRNNGVALVVALLQLIPALTVGYMEDRELIEREGEKHREYLRSTAALIPVKRICEFVKLLFFLK